MAVGEGGILDRYFQGSSLALVAEWAAVAEVGTLGHYFQGSNLALVAV